MDTDPSLEPLKPPEAKALARSIFEDGVVDFTQHARDEMGKDGLETTDCLNLVRAGVFQYPELEKNEWRYRVCTARMCIVIVFITDTRLRVITAWRN